MRGKTSNFFKKNSFIEKQHIGTNSGLVNHIFLVAIFSILFFIVSITTFTQSFNSLYSFNSAYSNPNAYNSGASVLVDSWTSHAATSYAGGSGTQEDPYLIETEEQLALLASSGTNSNTYFKQTKNLYLSSYSWKSMPFSGIYDGNNNCITGLNAPLFGLLSGATIRNLKLQNVNIEAVGNAAAITTLSMNSTITNVEVISGSIIATSNNGTSVAAGHVAAVAGGLISNCKNNAYVSSQQTAGGIVGLCNSSVTSCINTGIITAIDSVGGIAGRTTSSSCNISYCYNTGQIIGPTAGVTTQEGAGGILGLGVGVISHCANSGSVSGTLSGGIVGQAYASGNVSLTIEFCSNVGNIFAQWSCGGLLGAVLNNVEGDVVIDSCFVKCELIAAVQGVYLAGGLIGVCGGSLGGTTSANITISRTGVVVTALGPNAQYEFQNTTIQNFAGFVFTESPLTIDTSYSVVYDPANPRNGEDVYAAISQNNNYVFENTFGWMDAYVGIRFDIENWEDNYIYQVPVPAGIYSITEFLLGNGYSVSNFVNSIAGDVVIV